MIYVVKVKNQNANVILFRMILINILPSYKFPSMRVERMCCWYFECPIKLNQILRIPICFLKHWMLDVECHIKWNQILRFTINFPHLINFLHQCIDCHSHFDQIESHGKIMTDLNLTYSLCGERQFVYFEKYLQTSILWKVLANFSCFLWKVSANSNSLKSACKLQLLSLKSICKLQLLSLKSICKLQFFEKYLQTSVTTFSRLFRDRQADRQTGRISFKEAEKCRKIQLFDELDKRDLFWQYFFSKTWKYYSLFIQRKHQWFQFCVFLTGSNIVLKNKVIDF